MTAFERQNQLDVALQEIGKIERTLFMLDWLEYPELRSVARSSISPTS
jgi:TnpA family transposase